MIGKRFGTKKGKGAALVEYGILAGLVSVVAIGAVLTLGGKTRDTYQTVANVISTNAGSSTSAAQAANPTPVPASLVGVGAETQVLYSSNTDTGTFAVPAGIQPGDLMVMPIFYSYSSGANDLIVPAGWTRQVKQADASGYYEVAILTKPYQASDGTSITMTQSIPHAMSGQIYAFRGSDVQVRAQATSTGSGPTGYTVPHSLPDFTTYGAGAYALGVNVEAYTFTSGSTTITAPSGWNQTNVTTSIKNRLGIAWMQETDAGTPISAVFSNDITHASFGSIVVQIQ